MNEQTCFTNVMKNERLLISATDTKWNTSVLVANLPLPVISINFSAEAVILNETQKFHVGFPFAGVKLLMIILILSILAHSNFNRWFYSGWVQIFVICLLKQQSCW